MKNGRINSPKNVVRVEFDGGFVARRETDFLPDGAYFFEDDLTVSDTHTATVITCGAWLLELVELEAGELFFVCGEKQIRPNNAKRIGVFYAPFSISQPCFQNAKGRVVGIADDRILPAEISKNPFVFETDFANSPANLAQVIEILHSSRNRQSIELNPAPSLLSLKAKKLIDENYLVYPSIARIAARLKVSHEHLTRQFKRDFGLSPSAYLHQIRISDATFRLARGEEIIAVSQDVGYHDLSRFYKQFRKSTTKSPGFCRTALKPEEI